MRQRRKQQGFTLLEILIALFIFAILAVLSSQALQSVFSTKQATDKAASQLAEIQMAVILLERDIQQAAPRPIESQLGNLMPAFEGTSESLELTRNGYFNTIATDQNQSHLIRVAYQSGGSLIRKTWQVLDRAPGDEASEKTLLKKVGNIKFQYLDSKNKWQDKWPPASAKTSKQTSQANSQTDSNQNQNENSANIEFPKAVKVELSTTDHGNVTLIIPVAASASDNTKNTNDDSTKTN